MAVVGLMIVHGCDGPEDRGQVERILQAAGRGNEYVLDAFEGGIVVDGASRVGQVEGFLYVKLFPLVHVVLLALGHPACGHGQDAASAYGDRIVAEAAKDNNEYG